MIRLDNALFSFGPKAILHEVSLLISEGARVGLLGRNGSGKTTVFRLVLGDLQLEGGEIQLPRAGRTAYLPQHPDLPPEESILQHVLESHPVLRDLEAEILRIEELMAQETDPVRLDRIVERHRRLSREFESQGGYELEARVTTTLTGLGFTRGELLRPVGILSPGEKNRVALAKVLLTEADILLLDEPTNHLDFEMLEWLEGYLSGRDSRGVPRSTTVIVASHDRYFLNRVADQVVELRDGTLASYRGNYDDFVRQRSEELERQEKVYRKQQDELARDLEFIRRNFAAQKARQAKSREKRVDRLEIVDAPARDEEGPAIRFDFVTRPGNDILEVRGLACGYGANRLLDAVDLDIAAGDRVAMLGPNGSGKTTFLKCLAGELEPLGGRIRFGARTVTGYFRQEMPPDGSDDFLFSVVHDLVPQWSNQAVRDLLAAFLFRGDEVQARVNTLSGGERARLELLRLILSGANLFLLDEPTNHLDVYTRAALEESLLGFPGAILFVSHDRYFVERVATRVLAVTEGGVRQLFGGYEEYREAFRDERTAERTRQDEERRSRRTALRPNPRAAAAAQVSQESRLFRRISEVEEGIRSRHEESSREEHYRNPDTMRRLKRELADLEAELEALYREWEALGG